MVFLESKTKRIFYLSLKKVDGVLGKQNQKNLLSIIKDKPNAVILSGESGLGKTTMARIYASEIGSGPGTMGWTEHDAAVFNGVDDIRDLRESLWGGVMDGSTRVVCMDECHMLSKSSWNALLKDIEEPPNNTHWVFCTTEPSKIPSTIKSRCAHFAVKPIPDELLFDYLDGLEETAALTDEDLEASVAWAEGSPRRALRAVQTLVAGGALETGLPEDATEVIKFCRELGNSLDLGRLCVILGSLPPGTSGESIRRVVCSYYGKVALSGGTKADRAVDILMCFGEPYPVSELYPVIISLAKLAELD